MPAFTLLDVSPAWLPLVDVAAKATIVLALGGLLALVLRRASAAVRHLVWTGTLAAALAVPALSMALPRWQVALFTVQELAPIADAAPLAGPSDTPAATTGPAHAPLRLAPEDRSTTALGSLASLPWTTWLAAVWSIGTGLILLHLVAGILWVSWTTRRTHAAETAPWFTLAQRLAEEMGVRRVTFRRASHAAMPMTWGIVRPVVLLPAEADTWHDDRLRVVLLHELAHVKRADCLTHVVARIACAVYWINPLTWVAARQARAERERACDDLVLASGTPGPDYAAQLIEVARVMRAGRLSTFAASASLAMAHRSQLEGRLMAILDPSVPRSAVNRVRTAVAASSALLLLAPLVTLEPWIEVQAAASVRPAQVTPPPPPAPTPTPVPAPAPAPAPVAVPVPVLQPTPEPDLRISSAITLALESLPETIGQAIDGALQSGEKGGRTADPKVVAALMEAMKDSDREVRESALLALVRMRHPGTFDPLVVALRDSSAEVREHAAFGLGQLRDKRAIDPLKAALKDQSASVREQVVFALGQLRDLSAVDGLVIALRDESPSVREQAVFALGQLRDQRAVDPLVIALRDSGGNVREQAAFALGQLRARTAVDALIAALKDADVDVREQAAFALGVIGDPRAVDALTLALKDGSAQVRQQVAFALGQLAR